MKMGAPPEKKKQPARLSRVSENSRRAVALVAGTLERADQGAEIEPQLSGGGSSLLVVDTGRDGGLGRKYSPLKVAQRHSHAGLGLSQVKLASS